MQGGDNILAIALLSKARALPLTPNPRFLAF